VPLTVGLPTTVAVLGCVSLWNGPPLWLFAVLCAAAGFLLQAGAMLLARRLRRRGRA
jgi:hypothetical protein